MRYFNKSEFLNDPDKVDPEIMETADNLRGLAGVPVHVHVAWSNSGHSKNSWHDKDGVGKALDFHFGGRLTYIEQFACIRFFPNLKGIGFYPWWNNPGWHIDLRPVDLFWMSPVSGKYIYGAESLMKKLFASSGRGEAIDLR